ncbi:hypothetical protein [Bradyrhizobium yuanmingense]|jgi:hypothetical protein|uniref:hypothetical protein n=1 Tax=Bradyrhizobium yuanmingense TaxID=108015 RepID=UPI00351381FE
METDRELSFREELLEEIQQEILSLEGPALDEYLLALGMDPNDLLESFDAVFQDPEIAAKRRKFAAARQRSRESQAPLSASVLSFEPSKKREILAALTKRVDVTGDMTIAARNRRIESDDDLDSFLEACLRLGLIDESGKLKE